MHLRVSEALALIYFGYLSAAALVRALPRARRARVWIATAAIVCADAALLVVPQTEAVGRLRDWLPAAVILLAYFATGAFFVTPSPRVEAWLKRVDDRWRVVRHLERLPRAASVCLDLVYGGCFLLIPAGFAVLAATGRAGLADRYWTLVSAAEFGAFASLPWMQARPPWVIEAPRAVDRTAMRRASLVWVRRATIGANTFPSGHVSGSLAVAFALAGAMPLAAAVFLALALSIAAGCIAGRYHYIVDVLAGAALAVVAWIGVAWCLPGSPG